MSKSCLITGAAQYIRKMEENTVGKKNRVHELCHLPSSLAAFMDQFGEGKVYLHLKINLGNHINKKFHPKYTHSVMET